MSLGYNDRLRKGIHRGLCGDDETEDSAASVERGSVALAQILRGSTNVVVHTGAGISTASGVPDFRGAAGVWTREQQQRPSPQGIAFDEARPSLTHLAIVALYRAGIVKHVVSQNVDGLHLRSGLPRPALSELHGNIFAEACADCHTHFYRDRDVEVRNGYGVRE